MKQHHILSLFGFETKHLKTLSAVSFSYSCQNQDFSTMIWSTFPLNLFVPDRQPNVGEFPQIRLGVGDEKVKGIFVGRGIAKRFGVQATCFLEGTTKIMLTY